MRDGELLEGRPPKYFKEFVYESTPLRIEVLWLEVSDNRFGCSLQFLPSAGCSKSTIALLQGALEPLAARGEIFERARISVPYRDVRLLWHQSSNW